MLSNAGKQEDKPNGVEQQLAQPMPTGTGVLQSSPIVVASMSGQKEEVFQDVFPTVMDNDGRGAPPTLCLEAQMFGRRVLGDIASESFGDLGKSCVLPPVQHKTKGLCISYKTTRITKTQIPANLTGTAPPLSQLPSLLSSCRSCPRA